jgi:hypothetical protein
MADRNPDHLCPAMQVLYRQWLTLCVQAGLSAKAIVTWRSAADQDAAKAAGLSEACAGESPHNVCEADGTPASMAFDFGIFEADGAYVQYGLDARYTQAAAIGTQLGLVSGNTFPNPDYDHLELANWKTTSL